MLTAGLTVYDQKSTINRTYCTYGCWHLLPPVVQIGVFTWWIRMELVFKYRFFFFKFWVFEAVGTKMWEEGSVVTKSIPKRGFTEDETLLQPAPLVLLCCKHLKMSLLPKCGFTTERPESHSRIHSGIIKGPEGPKCASAQNVGTSLSLSPLIQHIRSI